MGNGATGVAECAGVLRSQETLKGQKCMSAEKATNLVYKVSGRCARSDVEGVLGACGCGERTVKSCLLAVFSGG